jgi:hypothetical protein
MQSVRFGVIHVGLIGPRGLSVYPQQQTSSAPVGRSVSCQQATRHFGRLAQPRREVDFLQSLVVGVPPATYVLRF